MKDFMYNKKYKVTIITVTYNSSKTLEKTILSVISQSFSNSNIEYIIIDGGSTDGTLDIIKKYQDKISKWVSEKDGGISDAMNKGIKMASGDFIGIIHADDWYEKDALENALNAFINTGADIVCGKVKYWQNDKPDYIFFSDPSKLNQEMTINHPSVFIKNEIYKNYGMFDLKYKYAMDYDLILRYKIKGLKFVVIDRVIANMSLDGASDRNWRKALYESYFIKVANGVERKKAFCYYVWQNIRSGLARFLKTSGFERILGFYRKHFSILKKEK